MFIGKDTPTFRTTLSPKAREASYWNEFSVVTELMVAFEEFFQSLGMLEEYSEELLELTEDAMGTLVWLPTSDSCYLPLTFLIRLDWPHPLSVTMWKPRQWKIGDANEVSLSRWTQQMV
ncbi:hypothetical protein GOP47_0007726 [Adiantum capillus-veneris]|uniref:Uncharacterized protein n=1 Tax=Adiantum capillus-veneris TaxID=13818 RepID=A0A9D4ZL78_ADICA|nr:hypothetical protein GOP47_0007726 [Adiantum capillus-veneris]